MRRYIFVIALLKALKVITEPFKLKTLLQIKANIF